MSILSIPPLFEGEEVTELEEQVKRFEEYAKRKRNWENAFQRWSNTSFQDGTNSYGCCGFGVMCDYCEDNSYGRPCVRALNEWAKVKHKTIDYNNRNFKAVWVGEL